MKKENPFEDFINNMQMPESEQSKVSFAREVRNEFFAYIKNMLMRTMFAQSDVEKRPPLSKEDRLIASMSTKVVMQQMGRRLEFFTHDDIRVYPLEESTVKRLIQMGADAALFAKSDGNEADDGYSTSS